MARDGSLPRRLPELLVAVLEAGAVGRAGCAAPKTSWWRSRQSGLRWAYARA